MSLLTDTLLQRVKMLKNWKAWVSKIAKVAKELMLDAEVYVIGSVVRGDFVAGSDVDILIVSNSVPERIVGRGKIKVLIEEKLNLPYYHPFEIHLLKPEEAELYLRKAGKYVNKVA